MRKFWIFYQINCELILSVCNRMFASKFFRWLIQQTLEMAGNKMENSTKSPTYKLNILNHVRIIVPNRQNQASSAILNIHSFVMKLWPFILGPDSDARSWKSAFTHFLYRISCVRWDKIHSWRSHYVMWYAVRLDVDAFTR